MRTGFALFLLLALVALPISAAEEAPHAEEGGLTELIFKWLNFILVFGAGAYFGAPWLRRKFADIRHGIRTEMEGARRQQESSRKRLAEVEERLAHLETEIESMRREARASATAERHRIQEAARREAERILATAHAEIESASRGARLELRAYTARLAVTLAEQRLQRQLTPETHAALFETFISNLSGTGGDRRH